MTWMPDWLCKLFCMKKKQPSKHQLFVFGFDHTIVMRDSEKLYKGLLAERRRIREDEVSLSLEFKWSDTEAEQAMSHTISHGVHPEQILNAIKKLSLTPEMEAFLGSVATFTSSHLSSKLIFVSESNDLYIETKCFSMSPRIHPHTIIANHAELSPDRHRILYRPLPSLNPNCPFCEGHFCKGAALQHYLDLHEPFQHIHFIGSVADDLCPAMYLRTHDVLWVRAGYDLDYIIKHYSYLEVAPILKCHVQFWTTGSELSYKARNYLHEHY